jgi:hypothetical protein
MAGIGNGKRTLAPPRQSAAHREAAARPGSVRFREEECARDMVNLSMPVDEPSLP